MGLGARAEARVADALVDDGWSVLSRNWRGGGGELDVVVVREGAVRFVEVKARTEVDDRGLESITPRKRAKLTGAARAWMLQHADAAEYAFLVALVDCRADPWSIQWVDDAFDGG